MKIRHPWLMKLIGFLGFVVVRLWLATLDIRLRSHAVGLDWTRPRQGPRFLLSFWHETLLIPAHFMGPAYAILISQHADGELIAEVCRLSRARTVRGSATRGGIEATRQLLNASQECHLAVVPDGPRGPRRRLKLGPVSLAGAAGIPIVAIGVGFARAWRLGTWDRFALPCPGSAVRLVLLPAVHVPAGMDKGQLEAYRQVVEQNMHDATALAQHWAESGQRLPEPARESAILESRESDTILIGPRATVAPARRAG